MRPIRGFISSKYGQTLVIKLESGRTIRMDSTAKISLGDEVIVAYDFTKNEHINVKKYDPETAVSIDLLKAEEHLGELITTKEGITDNDKIYIEVDLSFDIENNYEDIFYIP